MILSQWLGHMEHNWIFPSKVFLSFLFLCSADFFEYEFFFILPFSSNMRNKAKCYIITNNSMVHTDVINLHRHVLCMQLFTCRVLLELQFKIHTLELHFILKGIPHETMKFLIFYDKILQNETYTNRKLKQWTVWNYWDLVHFVHVLNVRRHEIWRNWISSYLEFLEGNFKQSFYF